MAQGEILILGAGNIGRGVVGGIFARRGWRLIFYRRDAAFLEALKSAGRYTVWQCGKAGQRAQYVTGFTVASPASLPERLAGTDLIAVCVYEPALPEIGRWLAEAFCRRSAVRPQSFCNILVCMNSLHAVLRLRAAISDALAPGSASEAYFRQRVGIISALVMSAAYPAPQAQDLSRFALCVTDGGYLEVEQAALCGEVALPPELHLVDNVDARRIRKLYLGNMLHAAAAYLGLQKGYTSIAQCYRDREIRAEVTAAFQEAEAGVLATYSFDPQEHAVWRTAMLAKLDTPSADSVLRVTANTWQKLHREERLVGPALLCAQHEISSLHLAHLIAAAFSCHQQEGDCPHCLAVKNGIKRAAEMVCGFTGTPAEQCLARQIARTFTLV